MIKSKPMIIVLSVFAAVVAFRVMAPTVLAECQSC
jgi:hypothetical protein